MPRKIIGKPPSVFLRAAFIGWIIALATVAWLPAKIMTRTTLGGHAEQLIAYLGTAILMGLAFQSRPRLAAPCALLIIYTTTPEARQLFLPCRYASFQHFV